MTKEELWELFKKLEKLNTIYNIKRSEIYAKDN